MSDHEVERIRAALLHLLQRPPIRWWTSYSLWVHIQDADLDLRNLILDRYGDATGKDGGAKTGPVHGISQILGRGNTPHVIDDKLECEGMVIGEIDVSPNPRGTAIFRSEE